MNQISSRWRQRLTLAAFGTTTMLTGLAIGYAIGVQHSLQRSLAGKDRHGI